MKISKRIVEKIVCTGENNCETLPGVALIEIADFHRVLIERHCGVIAYDNKEIRIKVKYGAICVCGEHLKLACMTNENLVITGSIKSVSLDERCAQ